MLLDVFEGEHDVEELVGGLGLAHDGMELPFGDLMLDLDSDGADGGDQGVLDPLAVRGPGAEDLDAGGDPEREAELFRGQGVFLVLLVGLHEQRDDPWEALAEGGAQLGEGAARDGKVDEGAIADEDDAIGGFEEGAAAVGALALPGDGEELDAEGIGADLAGLDLEPVKEHGAALEGGGGEQLGAALDGEERVDLLEVGGLPAEGRPIVDDAGDQATTDGIKDRHQILREGGTIAQEEAGAETRSDRGASALSSAG